MGAWGHGPFDNDAALDFLGECDGTGDPAGAVRAAMEAVTGAEGYLDGSVVSDAVAAAVLVAVRAGAPRPEDVNATEWLDANPFDADPSLVALGRAVLARAFEERDNEWWELWDDAGAVADVRAALAPYAAVLGA